MNQTHRSHRFLRLPSGELVFALVVVGLVTAAAIGPGRRSFLAQADVAMLYLAGIVVVALRCGRAVSIVAAGFSVAAYDFFFVEPYYTFSVAHSSHVLTFVTMFVTGIGLSSLAHRLREQEEERARLADLTRDISLRRRTDEMRSALLSAVSHDLRTPLAAIMGAATTLRDEARLPEAERMALLDGISSEAFRLERLVSSLLDMSRVEGGALLLRRAWLPIEEVIGSALLRVEDRLEPRPIRVQVDPDVPLLHLDPVVFEQVLVNLLENVARHTPATAAVEVMARRVKGAQGCDDVEIVVADRGPGLPRDIPPDVDVFEKFVRGRGTGLGLGLAICKGFVVAHGGTIRASNREAADGSGCVMTIRLPAGTPPTMEGR